MRILLITLLRFYKITLSLFLGKRCRFYPSCSDYACEAVRCYGTFRGTYLAFRRLCRCHPFSSGGCDFVPLLPKDYQTENER